MEGWAGIAHRRDADGRQRHRRVFTATSLAFHSRLAQRVVGRRRLFLQNPEHQGKRSVSTGRSRWRSRYTKICGGRAASTDEARTRSIGAAHDDAARSPRGPPVTNAEEGASKGGPPPRKRQTREWPWKSARLFLVLRASWQEGDYHARAQQRQLSAVFGKCAPARSPPFTLVNHATVR